MEQERELPPLTQSQIVLALGILERAINLSNFSERRLDNLLGCLAEIEGNLPLNSLLRPHEKPIDWPLEREILALNAIQQAFDGDMDV